MYSLVHEDRPDGGTDRDVDLLVEKGFLLLGSIEFQIDEHLMSHGLRIAPETRYFMAQVRDAAGDAATKLLDEARNRVEAGSAACVPDSGDAVGEEAGYGGAGYGGAGYRGAGAGDVEAGDVEAGDAGAAAEPKPDPAAMRTPQAQARGQARRATGERPRFRSRAASGRMAAHVGLGTACVTLIATLLVVGQSPSGALTGASGRAGVATLVSTPSGASGHSGAAVAADGGAATVRPAASTVAQAAKPDGYLRSITVSVAHDGAAPAIYPDFRAEVADTPPPMDATMAALGPSPDEPAAQPPYPDPRAWPIESGAFDAGPDVAEAEAHLALSRGARREVQRRLALARFNPSFFDGIFGPATRSALGDWQRSVGLRVTGYLDASALTLLRERTAGEYRAVLAAAKARKQARRAVLKSPLPPVSPLNADGCTRSSSGRIAYGRGVRCDFRGLRENIARLFG